jgi:hypothetical protein
LAINYSSTYNYLPTTGELVLAAYARLQIRRAEILNEHLANAANENNLLQVEWSNLGPLSWTTTLNSATLVQGEQIVTVPTQAIMVLDVYISIPNGDGTYTDRIITPLSRTEFSSQPNKLGQGAPTSYWFYRTINPQIYLWPVPDGNGPYTLNYYTFQQPQDVVIGGALNPNIPYRWLDANVAGLAYRLSRLYKPEIEAARGSDYKQAYTAAMTQDTEGTPLYLSPQTSGYWR